MGQYLVAFTDLAQEHLKQIYHAGNSSMIRKVEKLLVELSQHPTTGTGNPERLKGLDLWSRRLNKKDRLVYHIDEPIVTVTIVSARYHYSDK